MINYYIKEDFKLLPDYFWEIYNNQNKYAITKSYGYPMIPFYVGICDKGEEGQMHTEMWNYKEQHILNGEYYPIFLTEGFFKPLQKHIYIHCDIGYTDDVYKEMEDIKETDDHIQYALYHRPTKQYVYHSDECGNGFNGDTPYLSDLNLWETDDDDDICLEDGKFPSNDFDIHEYTCRLNKVTSLSRYITQPSTRTSYQSPQPIKETSIKPPVFDDEQLKEIDTMFDFDIQDIIKDL